MFFLDFLDLKRWLLEAIYLQDMSKVAFFGHISPNFFDDLFFLFWNPPNFLGTPKIFYPPQKFFGLPKFLKNIFFRPKKFFSRPKNPFLDFIDLKIFSNRLNSLQKHLLNLQIDEKNYIFNFSIYSKKLP